MSRQVRLASNVVRAGLRGVLVVVAAGLLMPFVASAQSGEPTPMVIQGPEPATADDLLQQVRKGWEVEKQEDKERERRFAAAREDQKEMLADAKGREAREEARSQALEKEYQEKEVKIAELEQALEQRMGNLGELFGVTRQIAGDTRGNVQASLTTAQFGLDRVEFLEKLGASKELPSIAELERLWAEMVREMVEQGKVVEFEADVFTPSGVEKRQVVRAGPFSAISNDEYLLWQDGKLQTLSRQPPARFLDTIAEYTSSNEELAGLAVDPSRGSLLAVLIESRELIERLPEGGTVGYAIIILGALAFAFGVIKFIMLFVESRKVAAQKKSSRPDKGNALGRVLSVAADNPDVDREQLELL
ncbi:MAG TPA: hypothetical protein PLW10_13790, partial [Myxococcota bacterium]|nr:hypothetical protein [Myxococcota bacterium]